MKIDELLEKTGLEHFTKEEIVFLLSQTEEREIQKIFAKARAVRAEQFQNKIFLYGFVYFSTYCKNNCTFCYFRVSNQKPPRYRKSVEEIVNTAVELKNAGIHLIDLTMGEDPYYVEHPEELVEIVKKVKEATGLPIMISPGVVAHDTIDAIKEAGADWYALYQETHTEELYRKLRVHQAYADRIHAKEHAKHIGMLIEEGLLTGIGDNKEDTAHSFLEMKRLKASQVRTMTFIPQEGTPLGEKEQSTFTSELLNIAVMRILFPDKLIPASLDVDGLRGLEERLNAGANVITSIIPPQEGYAGVANAETDIDEGYRTVDGIQETLKKCGLKNATAEEYQVWVEREKVNGAEGMERQVTHYETKVS